MSSLHHRGRRNLRRLRLSSSSRLTASIIRDVELSTKFKPKEIRKLHQQFVAIADVNGRLGIDGFRQSMGILGMIQDSILCQRLFAVFNESGSGYISFEEFAKGLGVLVKGTVDEKLEFAFAMTDIDGSGEITLDELEVTVDSIMRIYSGIMGSVNIATLDKSRIRKMFNQLDRNHDGMITLDEYKRGMKQHPEFVASLRGSDLFTVGQNNIIKEEQSKVRRYRRVCKSIINDVNEAIKVFDALAGGVSSEEASEDGKLGSSAGDSSESKTPPRQPSPRDSVASEMTLMSEEYDTDWDEPTETEDEDNNGTDPSLRDNAERMSVKRGSSEHLRIATRKNPSPSVPFDERLLLLLQTIRSKAQAVVKDSMREKVNVDYPVGTVLSASSSTPSPPQEGENSGGGGSGASRENQDFVMDTLLTSPVDDVIREENEDEDYDREDLAQGVDGEVDDGILGRYLTSAQKGSTVFFGHKNWDLVINVMKGIQMAVSRSAAEASRPLNVFDFSVKEKYTLVAGSKIGKHSSAKGFGQKDVDSDRSGRSCRFVDYAPVVYCKLREHFGIKNEDYVHSIGPGNMLSNLMLGSLSSLAELGSEGKSGSFFYFTSDGQFMVKTVHKEEHKLLRSILPQYYYHMTRSDAPDSLLCRIVGSHVVRLSKNSKIGANKIYFVVMTNMLNSELPLARRFDLKGSWVGRKGGENARANPKSVLKDIDFKELKHKIRIGPGRKLQLMAALKRDAKFLEDKHIIDYSLLLGVHKHKNDTISSQRSLASTSSLQSLKSARSQASRVFGRRPSVSSSCSDFVDEDVEEPAYVPFFQEDDGGMRSLDRSETYFVGVIDFLTLYSSKKVAERFGKTFIYDRNGISVQPPHKYSKRFLDFMDSVIE